MVKTTKLNRIFFEILKRMLISLGSIGINMTKMVEIFSKGLEFSSTKDDNELDYGLVDIPFGNVSNSADFLIANGNVAISSFHCSAIIPKGNVLTCFKTPCVCVCVRAVDHADGGAGGEFLRHPEGH
jgi:hypothetical protein